MEAVVLSMKVYLTPQTGMRTGVPYSPVHRPGGYDNYGYFDLKRRPEDINKIPEIRDLPELRQLIVMLNAPNSLFHTLGCEKSFAPSENPQYKRRMNSYFDIVYEVVNWNLDTKNFEGLYAKFEEFAGSKGDLPNSFGVEFALGITIFNEHANLTGLHTAIWNFGYGKNDAEAKREWRKGIAIVKEFFEIEIAANPMQHYSDQKMVSVGVVSCSPD